MKIKRSKPGLTFMSFNQTFTRVVYGTDKKFRVAEIDVRQGIDVEDIQKIDCQKQGCTFVELLDDVCLYALVQATDGDKNLKICSPQNDKDLDWIRSSSPILGVKINRTRLVVVTETALHIYNLATLGLLHTIGHTPPNPLGICALSRDSDTSEHPRRNFLTYPGSNSVGEVHVYDAHYMNHVCAIPAHHHPIQCVAFNQQGTRLATASTRGTCIRLWSLPDGALVNEFRRGTTTAVISSLSFNEDGKFLCVASDRTTVHIFNVEEIIENPSWVKGFMANVVPKVVTERFNQLTNTSFARITRTKGDEDKEFMCGMVGRGKGTRIISIDSEGLVGVYSLNTEQGGECQPIGKVRGLTLDFDTPTPTGGIDFPSRFNHS